MRTKSGFALALFYLCFLGQSFACDVCGCSSGPMGFNLMGDFQGHFIRYGYGQIQFTNPSASAGPIKDIFKVQEIQGAYSLKKGFRLEAYLPYHTNLRNIGETKQNLSGIGDLQIGANHTVWKKETKTGTELQFDGALRSVLPTGKYHLEIHDLNLPENFNPGKGSFALIPRISFRIARGLFGINSGLAYRKNFHASDGYSFGDILLGQAHFYSKIQAQKFLFIPALGLVHEFIAADHYKNKNQVHGTGGRGTFLNPSIQIGFKSIRAGIFFQGPLQSQYSEGEAQAGNRFNFQLTYLF